MILTTEAASKDTLPSVDFRRASFPAAVRFEPKLPSPFKLGHYRKTGRVDSFARFCLHRGREMDGPSCAADSAMFLHDFGNSAGPLQSRARTGFEGKATAIGGDHHDDDNNDND